MSPEPAHEVFVELDDDYGRPPTYHLTVNCTCGATLAEYEDKYTADDLARVLAEHAPDAPNDAAIVAAARTWGAARRKRDEMKAAAVAVMRASGATEADKAYEAAWQAASYAELALLAALGDAEGAP